MTSRPTLRAANAPRIGGGREALHRPGAQQHHFRLQRKYRLEVREREIGERGRLPVESPGCAPSTMQLRVTRAAPMRISVSE